jgi:hypothetical protein
MSEFNKINNVYPIVATTAALIRAFNLKNVRVPDARKNDYTPSKLSEGFYYPDEPLDTSQGDYLGSMLNTPVFADLTLVGGKYTDNITNKEVTYPTLKFAAVLLTVSFASRIIKTEIQGRNGTVKEYIGEDDAKVQVQGIICGYNGHYPAFEVGQLNDWRKAPVSKAVVSTFLQNIGIDNLVVESFDLPQVAGGYSYQTFNISCISDLPVELKITNNA